MFWNLYQVIMIILSIVGFNMQNDRINYIIVMFMFYGYFIIFVISEMKILYLSNFFEKFGFVSLL